MNPHRSKNLEILFSSELNNRQKLENLDAAEASTELFEQMIDQAVESAIVQPLPDGTGRQLEAGDSIKSANYYGPPIEIMDIPEGLVTLDIFIYAPSDKSRGRSINMSWRLKDGKNSNLLLQEYVSDRSLTHGTAAYRKDAPKVLSLIQESLTAYAEAAAGQ